MEVSVKNREILERGLKEAKVKPREGIKYLGHNRQGEEKYRLTLAPISRSRFVRYSVSGRRLTNVACAHGYSEFCRNLLVLDPQSRIKSSMVKRLGKHSVNFGNYGEMRENIAVANVGSKLIPQQYYSLCGCEAPKEMKMPVRDYRAMLAEHSQDVRGAIRRAMGAYLDEKEQERMK